MLSPIEEIENALEILGLPKLVTKADIKKQYRFLAQKYHPDRFTENTDPVLEELARDKMCEINDAYATIMASLKKE